MVFTTVHSRHRVEGETRSRTSTGACRRQRWSRALQFAVPTTLSLTCHRLPPSSTARADPRKGKRGMEDTAKQNGPPFLCITVAWTLPKKYNVQRRANASSFIKENGRLISRRQLNVCYGNFFFFYFFLWQQTVKCTKQSRETTVGSALSALELGRVWIWALVGLGPVINLIIN